MSTRLPAKKSRPVAAKSPARKKTPVAPDVPAPDGVPVTADDANRRPDLIRAAARLFREKGFDGTTVRDIAHAVGMRSGSPFYHFASKQEILLAVMEEGLRQGLERTEHVVALDLPPRERFRAMVRVHLGILLQEGNDFIPVMLYDWRALDVAHRARIIATKDRYDAIWQTVIHELHELGLIKTDEKIARLIILGAMNFSATWFKADDKLSIDEVADQVTDLFLTGAPARKK